MNRRILKKYGFVQPERAPPLPGTEIFDVTFFISFVSIYFINRTYLIGNNKVINELLIIFFREVSALSGNTIKCFWSGFQDMDLELPSVEEGITHISLMGTPVLPFQMSLNLDLQKENYCKSNIIH